MPKRERALPVIDRDDYLLRLIVLVFAGAAGFGIGHFILTSALTLWGPK